MAGTSLASGALTTTSANELLLACIASDAKTAGVTVTGVSGGGLTWTLVRRTNAQMGTAKVWRAFAPAQLERSGHGYFFPERGGFDHGGELYRS